MSFIARAEVIMNKAANAAKYAVDAFRSYGAQWLLVVASEDEAEQGQLMDNVTAEGERYRQAFAAYHQALRSSD